MYYTGIGSRKVPDDIYKQMTRIAQNLELSGYTLRSGGAEGADSAFEAGVEFHLNKHIFLPWQGFNRNPSLRHSISVEAYRLAELYHPAWHNCSNAAKKFHARNGYQVLGPNLDSPSAFVLCWTPNGKTVGGTGQAIRVAQANNIPVINMGAEGWEDEFDHMMELTNETV